ncbi:hypothetical protein [Laribacter hongkongensis]|uniref:hypothetical protein n=1 Tax=Laribacter hongkongensis TaxID=168471 RepID=UPI0003F4E298|nr:hypothetical protein [Laribacter hongkongensis]
MRIIKKPHGRSLTNFLPLLPAEKILRDAVRMNKKAIINSTRPSEMTAGNRVRAGFLRFLALGGDARAPVDVRRVCLQGAWISSELDLRDCKIQNSLQLIKCYFEKEVVLQDVHVDGVLDLSGSQLPGLSAGRLVAKGSVFLRDGFKANGEVCLIGAEIGSNLDCQGGNFDGNGKAALSANRAKIQGSVFLRNGFKANGAVRLPGVQIGNDIGCYGGEFDGNGKAALLVDSAQIQGNIFLQKSKINGSVILQQAEVGGSLKCDGGEFDGNGKAALSAELAKIEGGVFLRNGFKANGTVCLHGVQICNNLECIGGEFDGNGEHALSADSAQIQGNIFFRKAKINGSVILLQAEVSGSLECNGGEFDGNGKDALSAGRAKIQGSVFLGNGFKANGTVRLLGTQIGSNLECNGGQLKDVNGQSPLIADGMQVRGYFRFRDLKEPVGRISLAGSRVGRLIDDEVSWSSGLILDGFVYEYLSGNAPTSAQSRLEWLNKQRSEHLGKNFRPQPWK